jgi:hypothetical protein
MNLDRSDKMTFKTKLFAMAAPWTDSQLKLLAEYKKAIIDRDNEALNSSFVQYANPEAAEASRNGEMLEKHALSLMSRHQPKIDFLLQELSDSNALVMVEVKGQGKLHTVPFSELSSFLEPLEDEGAVWWPSHFESHKQYLAWYKEVVVKQG